MENNNAAPLTINKLDNKKLFAPHIYEVFKNQFKEIVYPKPERKTVFLSCYVTDEEDIECAAEAISRQIELIHLHGALLGCLCPISTLRLADKVICKPGTTEEICRYNNIAIFAMPTVKWDFEPYMSTGFDLDLFVREGEVGRLFISKDSKYYDNRIYTLGDMLSELGEI